MNTETDNAANVRKTLYLSPKVIAWLEGMAAKENRSMSNFVETHFQTIITTVSE